MNNLLGGVVGFCISQILKSQHSLLKNKTQESKEKNNLALKMQEDKKYNLVLKEVNNHQCKKENEIWSSTFSKLNNNPIKTYKWGLNISSQQKESVLDLWDYYNDPCRTLLELETPDSVHAVFGKKGEHMHVLNGLLAVRLAIIENNVNKENEAIDQLINYESICAIVQKQDKQNILQNALSFKSLYDLCIMSTNSPNVCKMYDVPNE